MAHIVQAQPPKAGPSWQVAGGPPDAELNLRHDIVAGDLPGSACQLRVEVRVVD